MTKKKAKKAVKKVPAKKVKKTRPAPKAPETPKEPLTLQKAMIEGRFRQKLSQEALGAKIGVTRQTVASIERGRTDPSFLIVKDASHVLGFSLDSFLPLATHEPEHN
jgi:DNA-binding XRE family transcriptional regulator